MTSHKVSGADYLAVLLHPETRKPTVKAMVRAAKRLDKREPFDTVVFTGNSGTLIGPDVAAECGKKMILVSKPGVSRHVKFLTEGATEVYRYAFIDDLICSGATVFRVKNQMDKDRPGSVMVGLLMYHRYRVGDTLNLWDPDQQGWVNGKARRYDLVLPIEGWDKQDVDGRCPANTMLEQVWECPESQPPF